MNQSIAIRSILFGLLLLTSLGSQRLYAQDELERGKDALNKGKIDAAIELFKQVLKTSPTSKQGNFYLGNAYVQKGQLDSAEIYLRATIKYDDENAEAYKLFGDVLSKKKHQQDALNQYKVAARLQPNHFEYLLALGLAYVEADSVDQGIITLTKAQQINDQRAEIYLGLGDAYAKQGVYPFAIEQYQKAIQLDPNNSAAHFKLAKVYLKTKRYNEGVREMREVVALDPNNAQAYFEMGMIYSAAKRYSDAVQSFQSYVKLMPNAADGYLNLSRAFYRARNFKEALKTEQKTLELDPNNVDAKRLLGYSYCEMNEYQKSVDIILRLPATKDNPTKAEDHLILGKAYNALTDRTNAVQHLEAAIKLDSTLVEAYGELGGLYMWLRRYDDAIRMYEKKIGANPKSIASYVNLGLSLLPLKRYEEAEAAFKRALKLSPEYIQGHIYLATVYALMDSAGLQQKEYEYALTLIGKDEAKHPKEAQEVYYRMGIFNFQAKKYLTAIDFFRKALKVGLENFEVHLRLGQCLILGKDNANEADSRAKCEEGISHLRFATNLEKNNAEGHLWLGRALILCRFPGEHEVNKQKTEEAKSEFRKVLQIEPNNQEAKKALELL